MTSPDRAVITRVLLGLGVFLIALVVFIVLSPQAAQAGGSGNYPPPASGDWVITTDTAMFSETREVRGNVLVQPGSRLDLDRVTLKMNCSVAGQYRIEVLPGGALEVTRSTITASNMSLQYYIVVRGNSSASISDSTLEGMGWREAPYREQFGLAVFTGDFTFTNNLVRNNRVGLYVDNGTPTVSGNNFTGNFRGAWFFQSAPVILNGNTFHSNEMGLFSERSAVLVIGCRFLDNENKGIGVSYSDLWVQDTSVEDSYDMAMWVWESNVTMANGTLDARTYDLILDENSTMVGLNISMDTHAIKIEDQRSKLTVYYLMDVKVSWWSDGGPVDNATVNVTGPDGTEVANGTTGPDGLLRSLPVPGYDYDHKGVVFHNPFNLTALASGLKGNATAELERSGQVNITIDDLLPGLNVTFPPVNGYYNRRDLDITGVLWDNESGPSLVEVSVDGKNFTNASGVDLWNLTVSLTEGLHNITVRGWDVAGNNRTFGFNITIDTVPPKVAIKGPKSGLVTNKTRIWVNGTAEKGANLTIDGRAVNNTNGTWGLFLDLVEGMNQIVIEARDLAGNIGRTGVNVTRDTMVDPFTLEPVNGTSTNQKNLTLKGWTEPGTFVRISWTAINGTGNNTTTIERNLTAVAGSAGNFTFRLVLIEGYNNFTIYARDVLNNTKSLNLTYHLDSVAPLLVMTSPKSSPYYTNKNGVNIKGRTEEGARVYLSGQELQLYELQFTIRVEVYLGYNNFTLSAVDAAGNVVKFNITIIVDKTPPSLNISRPFKTMDSTRDEYYTVTGFTEPGATIYINGISYDVGVDGHFSAKRNLAIGNNKMVITAKDQAGNQRSVERVIVREKAPPDVRWTYFSYLLPICLVVAIVLIVLIFLYRTGRFKGLQAYMQKRRDARMKEEMEEERAEVGASKGDKEVPAGIEIAIPTVSDGKTYDDDIDAKDPSGEDVQEMEELDDKDGKDEGADG